ncbi:MAG: twin-arginine translocase TatA/TatE family subunit [Oligoflexia bacterium]|nr:twin-arginine translocase TatA/TatE family subunit [Oligoflexia bacterium]
MFGLGLTEILLLVLLAFLVFGPQQFPIVARNFIKFLNELKDAFTEVKSEFYNVQTEVDKQIYQIKDELEEELDSIKEIAEEPNTNNKTTSKNSSEQK